VKVFKNCGFNIMEKKRCPEESRSDELRNLADNHTEMLFMRQRKRSYKLQVGVGLPGGKIIEKDVRPLDGYFGKDREGKHQTLYLE
jgi:hypothetical protein